MVGSLAGAAASQKVTEVRNVGVAQVFTCVQHVIVYPGLPHPPTGGVVRFFFYAIVIRCCRVEGASLNG